MVFFFAVIANLPWFDLVAAPGGIAVEEAQPSIFCCWVSHGHHIAVLHRDGQVFTYVSKAKKKKNPENHSKLVPGRLHFQEEM